MQWEMSYIKHMQPTEIQEACGIFKLLKRNARRNFYIHSNFKVSWRWLRKYKVCPYMLNSFLDLPPHYMRPGYEPLILKGVHVSLDYLTFETENLLQ